MITFEPLNIRAELVADAVGFIPEFLDENDPRPAREQINEAYAHGGGRRAFSGFTRTSNGLQYPGDPPMKPYAQAHLRDETIVVFPHAWTMIVQADGSWEVARLD